MLHIVGIVLIKSYLAPACKKKGEGENNFIYIIETFIKYKYIYICMGRTRYNRISQILHPLEKKTITLDTLRRNIMVNIGCSGKIINDTINFMVELGLIRETTKGWEVLRSKAEL